MLSSVVSKSLTRPAVPKAARIACRETLEEMRVRIDRRIRSLDAEPSEQPATVVEATQSSPNNVDGSSVHASDVDQPQLNVLPESNNE